MIFVKSQSCEYSTWVVKRIIADLGKKNKKTNADRNESQSFAEVNKNNNRRSPTYNKKVQQKHKNRCKYYNKMNNKIEQRKNRAYIVKFTSIKLNKSIAFLEKICYYENSRETKIKTKNKGKLTK